MTYEGLARRYRPQTFEDVVGQAHVVKTLAMAIEKKRWAPAYLFIGGRGLGKTSMARLLAKSLNCEKGPTSKPCGKCEPCAEIAAGRDIDVLEIDAASHTGVDNVRDVIIQSVGTAPVRGHVKVFIIDEVHMLSTAAFNALLKTLEEPPPNVVFILATTEGHRVPTTIRSRCQRFDFRPIGTAELVERLKSVASKEKIKVAAEALDVICEHAEGGMRDALSALDLVSSFAADRKIEAALVEEALGLAPSAAIADIVGKIVVRDAGGANGVAQELLNRGIDAGEIIRGLMGALRRELHATVIEHSGRFGRGRVIKSLELVISALDRIRYSRHPQLELELVLARLAVIQDEELMLREIYEKVVGEQAGSSSVREEAEIDPMDIGASAGASMAERSGEEKRPSARLEPGTEQLKRIRDELSPVAAALLDSAELVARDDGYCLIFQNSFHRERFLKDEKFLRQAEEILRAEVGKDVALEVESASPPAKVESAVPVPSPKNGRSKSSVINDPGLEKLKKIFKTDVVEVLDADALESRRGNA